MFTKIIDLQSKVWTINLNKVIYISRYGSTLKIALQGRIFDLKIEVGTKEYIKFEQLIDRYAPR